MSISRDSTTKIPKKFRIYFLGLFFLGEGVVCPKPNKLHFMVIFILSLLLLNV
jgi:hypothetical protein